MGSLNRGREFHARPRGAKGESFCAQGESRGEYEGAILRIMKKPVY